MAEQRCINRGERARGGFRWKRCALGLALALGLAGGGGCLDRPIGALQPVTTNLFVTRIAQTSVDKIDLLFMIDNSSSMSDKQAILRLAVPDLVQRLVNPVCITADGSRGETPAPGAPCPQGQAREFNAIKDINVAVISSSLGDAGADNACARQGAGVEYVPDRVDLAHLVGSLPRGRVGANEHGFLEWRPGVEVADFSSKFERMVESVGESGCGWEASLESWYRFLVEPFPYQSLVRVDCPGAREGQRGCVVPATDAAGQVVLDQELLNQRAAFLRPDSLVAVIMLSDENDCSVAVGGSSFVVGSTNRPMNRGSTLCDTDPNAKCCYPCGIPRVPDGCTADPICDTPATEDRLPPEDDGTNLRCFDQKRRFGYDFLYPTERYVNALREPRLCAGRADLSVEGCPEANLVQNPLYAEGRDRSLVFLGGIVGVPWQPLASAVDADGEPLTDRNVLRYKTAPELRRDDTWGEILGSPGVRWRGATETSGEVASRPPVPPRNPLMIESQFPRDGVTTGNDINGREYQTDGAEPGTPGDLEYACIFPLPEPRDCSRGDSQGCDCKSEDLDRPLCEQDPGVSTPGTTQYWAKAYPGLRQLQVLQDYGDNSIVASICARNVDITTRDSRADFGYRPAVDTIVERLKERLGDRCLPRALLTDADDAVPCTLIETVARPTEACDCDLAARRVPDAQTASLVRAELASDPAGPCGPDDPECLRACLCEVLQVQDPENANPPDALRSCQEEDNAPLVEGWCYVANNDVQQIGNPDLVAECPATKRQILRFVGQGLRDNTTTFVACQGSSLAAQNNQ